MVSALHRIGSWTSHESPDCPQRAPARAIRNVGGFYPSQEFGMIAVDGSILDGGEFEDYAFSKTWRDPDCPFCLQPRFRRLVPRRRQSFRRSVSQIWKQLA